MAFNLTERFKLAVSIINLCKEAELPGFLERIIQTMIEEDMDDNEKSSAFTEDERESIPERLIDQTGIPAIPSNPSLAEQSNLLIEGCTFILEQTAYHNYQPQAFYSHLKEAGIADKIAKIFVIVWKGKAQQVLDKFRSAPMAPLALSEVNWRLHLQLSNGQESKINKPSAIFQFVMDDDESVKKGATRSFITELNQEQLNDFYLKLERIQEQLDHLN